MKTFALSIARLDKEVFSGEAVSVTVPAETGEMTLLADHTAIIAKLKPGRITVKGKDDTKEFDAPSGALEFSNNKANIILF